MKKAIAAAVLVIAIVAAFFAGTALGKAGKDDSGSTPKSGSNNGVQNKAENEDEVSDEVIKTPKNVFFSPNTGDDNNDASQWSPVKTKKQAEAIAKDIVLGKNEEIVILEYLMTVDVKTQEAAGVFSEAGGINMIPFTGSADGYYFKGEIVGLGCDTQKYLPNDGGVLFSARYMLKGKDYKGQDCSVFIENNGSALELCTPTIITDSRALSEWQSWDLKTIVVPVGGGVSVNVYRIHKD